MGGGRIVRLQLFSSEGHRIPSSNILVNRRKGIQFNSSSSSSSTSSSSSSSSSSDGGNKPAV